jgi:hypothetical protein
MAWFTSRETSPARSRTYLYFYERSLEPPLTMLLESQIRVVDYLVWTKISSNAN